jgi:hypothetical protein
VTDHKTNVLILAGHSHTAALIGAPGSEAGIRLLPVAERGRVFGLHESSIRGVPIRSDAYWSALVDHTPGNSIALLYTGNEHNSHFLFEQPPYFDLVPRGLERLPIEPDADIVPESLVRAKFRSLIGPPLCDLIMRLKAQAPYRLALVGSPPPPRRPYDRQSIEALLPLLPSYEVQSLEGSVVRQTSPTKMLKLWHVLQEIFKEVGDRNDVEFVPVLRAATDGDGFLKDEFSDTDITHANQAYGRILLDRLTLSLLQR